MEEIGDHWGLTSDGLDVLINSADGLAVLALLANAGAKDWPGRPGNPELYKHKAALVTLACRAAGPDRSWVDWHDDMHIYFIETGLSLDGEPLQFAFHFAGETQPDLPDWPQARGRRWRGQRLQSRALEIVHFLLKEAQAG